MPSRKRSHSEHDIQSDFVQKVRLLTKNKGAPLLFSIPNGIPVFADKATRCRVGAFFKREGLVAGVPDLYLARASHDGSFHGLFLETKTAQGRLSKEQRAVRRQLEAAGYRVEVYQSTCDGLEIVQEHLGVKIL